jgi:hypothetical protein
VPGQTSLSGQSLCDWRSAPLRTPRRTALAPHPFADVDSTSRIDWQALGGMAAGECGRARRALHRSGGGSIFDRRCAMKTAGITTARGRGEHLRRQLRGVSRSTRLPDFHVVAANTDEVFCRCPSP